MLIKIETNYGAYFLEKNMIRKQMKRTMTFMTNLWKMNYVEIFYGNLTLQLSMTKICLLKI